MAEISVYPDPAALTRRAAEMITALAAEIVPVQGRFSMGLSGGSTPRALFTLLASDDYAQRIPWSGVHVFWGDERCVPPDHTESNYRMAREALLDHVPIPAENIHRVRAELSPAEAAQDYEQTLRSFFAAESDQTPPRFDLLLLGMGDDGHTASLFPHTAALHEHTRWVIENRVEKLNTWRITLTVSAINAAAQVLFLVIGSSKATVLRDVLHGPYQPGHYPSQRIGPINGRLIWLLDAAAAALL
ncbi:MAG: 6-phosphogluconolactonase [Chloroflexi bacterium]|nr:6-phosphogluconolactonase [Chloroflexota bacterium]